MADNGKIIRNGAEIQIDENGNVVARPAEGQEFIVEDDARVGTLEAENFSTGRSWQNVESSRELDVVETNDTDSEILVYVSLKITADGTEVGSTLSVNTGERSTTRNVFDSGERFSHNIALVPPGDTYEVNSFNDTDGFEIRAWTEYRP